MAGEGLESLIPDDSEQEESQKEAVFLIETEKIKPNPHQPRSDFDKEGLEALAASIEAHGVLQPLVVTRIEEEKDVEYQLVAGERRLMASKMVGLEQVPVIIRKPTEKQKLELSLIENVQRQDLNPVEKAKAYKKLKEDFDFVQREVADLVGASRVAVSNTIRLLELPDKIKEALEQGEISEGHGRAILKLDDGRRQLGLYQQIVNKDLSVRKAEQLARNKKEEIEEQQEEQEEEKDSKVQKLQEKVEELSTERNVDLKSKGDKMELTIDVNSEQDLEDLLKKIE